MGTKTGEKNSTVIDVVVIVLMFLIGAILWWCFFTDARNNPASAPRINFFGTVAVALGALAAAAGAAKGISDKALGKNLQAYGLSAAYVGAAILASTPAAELWPV